MYYDVVLIIIPICTYCRLLDLHITHRHHINTVLYDVYGITPLTLL